MLPVRSVEWSQRLPSILTKDPSSVGIVRPEEDAELVELAAESSLRTLVPPDPEELEFETEFELRCRSELSLTRLPSSVGKLPVILWYALCVV